MVIESEPSPPHLGSIVIPAHNEATVIRRCLDSLFDGLDPARVEVVVSCNGCTDSTASTARASGHPVTVVETDVASKIVALRAGDRAVESFPRIYLDADVVLTGSAAEQLFARLDGSAALAARPPIHYAVELASWPVRAYYRARTRVPAVMNSLWGAGVYGLSQEGRSRFGEFPDVVADDLFIDGLFAPDETEIVDTSPVIVNVPRRVRPLLNILRRTSRGNAEADGATGTDATRHPQMAASTVAREVLATGRDSRSAAFDAIIYLTLAAFARVLVLVRPAHRWERDDSSREI